MRRKRRKNKQIKLITITSLSLLFLLTVGYAAFSTNINITAKANISKHTYTIEQLKNKYCNTTSGDGLYKDTYENNRCIYKGTNPNNYINFNDEIYRIVAIETDNTVKIIKNKEVVSNMNYDTVDNNRYTVSGYCQHTQGCSWWASQTTTYNSLKQSTSKIEVNGTNYMLPTNEAIANQYLNSTGTYKTGGFYNTLSINNKNLIQKYWFNIGIVGNGEITEILNQESKYQWQGNIGMLNVSDYLKSIINENTYLNNIYRWYWLINPYVGDSNIQTSVIGGIRQTGVVYYGAGSQVGFVPVLHLKSTIILEGSGTNINPYTINLKEQ